MKILCLQLLKITDKFPLNGYPVLVELAGQISRLLVEKALVLMNPQTAWTLRDETGVEA